MIAMVKRSRLPKDMGHPAEHRLEAMPMMFYASWYKTDVAPNLTKEQKEKLLKKISDISLEKPIYDVGVKFDKKEFPELAPYSHTEKISGLQLYAVMTELFAELHPEISKKIGKPYAELPF
jgi:hypothetical protein